MIVASHAPDRPWFIRDKEAIANCYHAYLKMFGFSLRWFFFLRIYFFAHWLCFLCLFVCLFVSLFLFLFLFIYLFFVVVVIGSWCGSCGSFCRYSSRLVSLLNFLLVCSTIYFFTLLIFFYLRFSFLLFFPDNIAIFLQ